MKAAVCYVRVSTAQQAAEGLSLDAQRRRLEEYCAAHGLEVVEFVTDAGKSAFKPLKAREGGRRVLELVAERKVSAVVVLKLDRLFRNTSDALATVTDWDKAHVALHIAEMGGQNVDTSSALGRVFFTMLGAFAEFERNLISERTKVAIAHKRATGDMRTGGDAPYGWLYEGKELKADAGEQLIRQWVLEQAAGGMSQRAIVKALNEDGAKNRAGGRFTLTQVGRMLKGNKRTT